MISQSKHMWSQVKDGDEASLAGCKETNEWMSVQLYLKHDKYFQCGKDKTVLLQNYYEECPASK